MAVVCLVFLCFGGRRGFLFSTLLPFENATCIHIHSHVNCIYAQYHIHAVQYNYRNLYSDKVDVSYIHKKNNRSLLLLCACRLVSMQEADKKMTMIFWKHHKRHYISVQIRLGLYKLYVLYYTQKRILLYTIMYNVCL